MAFEEYSDYEQEQLVKKWLKDNMLTIIAGVALGIAAIYGYHYWQASKVTEKMKVAEEFEKIEQVLAVGEPKESEQMIADLENKYGQNMYTIESRMLLAKSYVAAGELDAAVMQYEKIIESKPTKPLAELSHIRLARLLVAKSDYDKALALLDSVHSVAYESMVDEIQGDISLAKGDQAKASGSYELALNSGEGYSGRNILEMKLSDSKIAESVE